jgi:hypothetical protein
MIVILMPQVLPFGRSGVISGINGDLDDRDVPRAG